MQLSARSACLLHELALSMAACRLVEPRPKAECEGRIPRQAEDQALAAVSPFAR